MKKSLHTFRNATALLFPIALGLGIPTPTPAATVVLSPSQGQGADAYTDSNQLDTAFGATDPSRLLVRRANTKMYLRYDLAVLGGISAIGTITAVELRMNQIGDPLRLDEDMEVFGINLNYDFSTDGRLGIDWDPTELTHANAPASGAGGGVSVANSRSILFGTMQQSGDGVLYTYSENDTMTETPMLDYLNGGSDFSSTATELRALIVAEAPDQARNTKIFPSSESGTGGSPVLVITYEESSGSTWAGYDILETGDVDTSNWLGFINVNNSPWIYSYNLDQWMYIEESSVNNSGSWTYVPKFGQ